MMRRTNRHPCSPSQLGGCKPWCKVPAHSRCAPLSSALRDEASTQWFLSGWKVMRRLSRCTLKQQRLKFQLLLNVTQNKGMANVALKHTRGAWNAGVTLTDGNKKGGLCPFEPTRSNCNPQRVNPDTAKGSTTSATVYRKARFLSCIWTLANNCQKRFHPMLDWSRYCVSWILQCKALFLQSKYWRVLTLIDFFIPVP